MKSRFTAVFDKVNAHRRGGSVGKRRLTLLTALASRLSICVLLAGVLANSVHAENLPEIRPALIGSGPNALINLIDAQGLMKRGQGDAILLFWCRVDPDGKAWYYRVYRYSEGGQKLKDEVKLRIYPARFIPAVYNHHNVYAWFQGAVMFRVANGKPHLRIFANQQTDELAKESDFIEPQSIWIPNHYYEPVKYPYSPWSTEDRPAIVDLAMKVDASGGLQDIHVMKETPAGKNFGETAVKKLKTLTFLPAFRNGRPVASTSTIPYTFLPGGWDWKP